MKIEANDKEVQDIFSLGYFRIPRFQRPYSWELDEVESFWNDIVNEKTDSYFIGSMVVYQKKKPLYGIVDGQQRLTTITLLLSAIRNGFRKLDENNLALGVHKYIEKPNIDNEQEFVLNSETSFPYFQKHIQTYDGLGFNCDVGSEEVKLETAFKFLTEKLNARIPELQHDKLQGNLFTSHETTALNELKKLRDKILSLKLVFIELDNEDDAYLIFETLNARGRDLTTSDLIKNLILKKLKSKNATLDQAKQAWTSLIKQFDDINENNILDSFLLHFWLSKYSYTTDKKLFSSVKDFVGEHESQAELLIAELSKSSLLYSKIVYPFSVKWSKESFSIRDSLVALNSFKVKQQSSMVLSILRALEAKTISLKVAIKALKKIELFHYSFNTITSQRSSGSISTGYSRIAIQLSNSRDQKQSQAAMVELDKFLKSKFPERSEFVLKFKDLAYLSTRTKHKTAIVYALTMLIPKSVSSFPIDHNSLTVEHIIPQKHITDTESEKTIGSIGNLTLLDKEINSNLLKDKEPNKKIEILDQHGHPVDDMFLETDDFNDKYVETRTELIAEEIYSRIRDHLFKQ